ncbi:TNF receptor-associated factor 6 isoform X2 [Exaiptasia diaphana]|nr:TNF receptor-associated factor 6 isoform X2 [Exaiptasia diaphana]
MSRSLEISRGTTSNEDLVKRKAQSLVTNIGKSTEGIDEYFDPPLESKYECPICLLGLREPVQTQCGHRFCRNCIVRSLRDAGNKCPVDNVPLSESGLYPDNFAKREMGMFTVWCRYHKERGCPWKGTLNELESHHKECPKFKTTCPKCKEKITNEELPNHREKVCPKERIKCPLHFMGCKEENFIPEVNKHIASHFASHVHDLAKAVLELQIKVDNQAKPTKAVEEGARGGQKSSAGYSGYSEDRLFENTILLQPDLKRLSDRMTRLETRVIDLEGRVSNGTFIWKIDNYDQCRAQAVNHSVPAIHSPPFYTGLYGYKMCLRMNLNGVDSGVDRHISLFVHMMQGEWDDILEWPFTGRITLAILDQSENVEFRRPISETLVAKPNLLAFQKPTTHRNHKGYGYVEFCQIDQLVQEQFVKNNSMLVRIQVFH